MTERWYWNIADATDSVAMTPIPADTPEKYGCYECGTRAVWAVGRFDFESARPRDYSQARYACAAPDHVAAAFTHYAHNIATFYANTDNTRPAARVANS